MQALMVRNKEGKYHPALRYDDDSKEGVINAFVEHSVFANPSPVTDKECYVLFCGTSPTSVHTNFILLQEKCVCTQQNQSTKILKS